jgi:hypothetical protein
MKIPSVSTGAGASLPTRNNSEIKMLEKQKEQLEKQVQTTKESNADSKTKQQIIKDLQSQIQQVESQIQQKRNENLAQNPAQSEKSQESSKTGDTASQPRDDLSSLSSLVEASASYSRARVLNSTKNGMEGRIGILEQEIKLDGSRGLDPKAKKEELSDIKQRSTQLNQKLGETLKTSKDQAEDGASTDEATKTCSVSADSNVSESVMLLKKIMFLKTVKRLPTIRIPTIR